MRLLDYDIMLEQIGQFGPFQKRILFFLSLVSGAGGLAVVVFVLTGFEQNYRCQVQQCEHGPHLSYYGELACNGPNSQCEEELRLPSWYEGKVMDRKNRCRNMLVMDEKCTIEKTSWKKYTILKILFMTEHLCLQL